MGFISIKKNQSDGGQEMYLCNTVTLTTAASLMWSLSWWKAKTIVVGWRLSSCRWMFSSLPGLQLCARCRTGSWGSVQYVYMSCRIRNVGVAWLEFRVAVEADFKVTAEIFFNNLFCNSRQGVELCQRGQETHDLKMRLDCWKVEGLKEMEECSRVSDHLFTISL